MTRSWRLTVALFLVAFAVAIVGDWTLSLPLLWGGTAAMGAVLVNMIVLYCRDDLGDTREGRR